MQTNLTTEKSREKGGRKCTRDSRVSHLQANKITADSFLSPAPYFPISYNQLYRRAGTLETSAQVSGQPGAEQPLPRPHCPHHRIKVATQGSSGGTGVREVAQVPLWWMSV